MRIAAVFDQEKGAGLRFESGRWSEYRWAHVEHEGCGEIRWSNLTSTCIMPHAPSLRSCPVLRTARSIRKSHAASGRAFGVLRYW